MDWEVAFAAALFSIFYFDSFFFLFFVFLCIWRWPLVKPFCAGVICLLFISLPSQCHQGWVI